MEIRFRAWAAVVLLASLAGAGAQPPCVDASCTHDIAKESLVRVWYDNDGFSGLNRYYSQGFRAEYIAPELARWRPMQWLLGLKYRAKRYYGLSLRHAAYTADNLEAAVPAPGDRPYAGATLAGVVLVCNNVEDGMRLTSQLEAGVMGPWAGAAALHGLFFPGEGQPKAQGWGSQMRLMPAAQYSVMLERRVIELTQLAELVAHGRAAAGTLRTDVGMGAMLRVGRFAPYFWSLDLSHKSHIGRRLTSAFQCYGLVKADLGFTLRDATLQGGYLRRSAHELGGRALTRAGAVGSAGGGITYRGLGLELTTTWATRSFDAGRAHGWGSVRLMVRL